MVRVPEKYFNLGMNSEDIFLRNFYAERNEAARSFDCRISYDDGWISTHVDFAVGDEELSAAPDVAVLMAERREEARDKLKNAVVCLTRLLPPRPREERVWTVVSTTSFAPHWPRMTSGGSFV